MKKYYVVMDDGEYWHYSKPFNTHEEAAALAQVLKQSFDEGLYIFIEAEKE
jgi:hypothetical protein